MNLQQLEYFICVADMFNYTAAAKKLNITQSALSQSIAKLEAELNTSLFYKEGRNIKMTADAESFYVHAKTALESVNFGINNMHSKNNTLLQPIVLLCSIGISSIFLSELVKEWLNVKPFVPQKIFQRPIDNIGFDIKTNNADFAIMPIVGSQKLLDDEMEHKPIFRDRYYAVVSDNNPLAGEESLSLRDLNSQTLIISNQRIMDVNLRYFPEHGFSYKNYMIVSDISELAILLAKSNTAVCTTCTKYSPEICQCLGIKQIPILDTGIQYNLVWKETRKLTTIQKDFKQFVFDYCKKLSNQK